jgi:DUF971 family protein
MAGLDRKTPIPTRIVVHQQSRVLEIEFEGGGVYRLSFEFLRVHSPSAEVRGHGPGQETLQTGKRTVGIEALEPVGNYAVQPRFSDGHATGIYSWDYLHDLAVNQESRWQDYLRRLEAAGQSRDPQPQAGAEPPSTAPSHTHPRTEAGAAPRAETGAGFQAVPLKRHKQTR